MNGILKKASLLGISSAIGVGLLAATLYMDQGPDDFNVTQNAQQYAAAHSQKVVVGYTSVAALLNLSKQLLEKPGGYLTNDVTPPSVLMDNVPNFEMGMIINMRDFARALRQDFSRNRSQSVEDKDLAKGEPKFAFDNNSWLLPATESEYRDGINYIESYLVRLADDNDADGQFFARADNLRDYLQGVETRLGSYVHRLAASAGEFRENTDLAGDANATQSKSSGDHVRAKTSFFEVDDNFYEARGYAFGLVHVLRALAVDLEPVLQDKNAVPQLNQIIRELEQGLQPTSSPMVLNGSGYGLVPNYSLTLASYLSRANAAIIDLGKLLKEG